MKAIQSGNSFRIYDDSMKTFDALPPKAYLVNFNDKEGFFLTLYPDIKISEKIYGVHEEKINKVLNTFKLFNRNLGVILSGDKGIGKSLFSKRLAQRGMEEGLPLIIVNSYVPGIAEYINTIEQEVIVLFDEFDKIFDCGDREESRHKNPQTEMLTLFDGIATGKKLFVITCNEIRNLNDFLINRPGRFHYHFRFKYPSSNEIKQYLMDAIDEKYYNEINQVIAFSHKVSINYDCLRAIAFELNCGSSFQEAIEDLNIVNVRAEYYTVILHANNGEKFEEEVRFNFFDNKPIEIELSDPGDQSIFSLYFTPKDAAYNEKTDSCTIHKDKLLLELRCWVKNDERLYEKYKNVEPEMLEIKRREQVNNIHYNIGDFKADSE